MRRAGFSLLELMVAVAVFGVVISQVLSVFARQHQTYLSQERALDIQEDARLVVDLMLQDVRAAGFLVPALVGVASIDGGTTGPDTFCVSNSEVFSEAVVAAAMLSFGGASLASTLGPTAGSVAVPAANRDIDADGTNDFFVGQGIIVAGGTSSHCARITALSATAISFTPDTPNVFSAAVPGARAVPAHIYELNSGTLSRNTLTLSSQVEDLQVEFGVDTNANGQLNGGEAPIHVLNGLDSSRVRGVQLSVLTRTPSDDPTFTGPGRQQVANRVAAGTPDAFRRRLVTGLSTPRNLL